MNLVRVLPALAGSILVLWAQEEIRKPSPFPEKNRERQSAESRKRVSPPVASRSPGAKVDDTGKACFFTASTGSATGLVAAHATYPLGSRVKVTNVGNGKTVELEIVDRFPPGGRIINVSEAAARELGFVEAGTADVKLEPVRQGTASREQ